MNTRASRRLVLNRGLIAETGIIPDGYKLLQDSYALKVTDIKKNVMVEDMHGKQIPVMRVTGIFQKADSPNANGRVYERGILGEAVQGIQEDLGRRAVYGEYDHPSDAKIHLDRISHLITKNWMDGLNVYGEAEILDNQFHGAALRGLFERKCQVGISSRGVGDMEERQLAENKTAYYVLEGYSIVTYDAVAEPSVGGATLAVMESLKHKTKPIHEARSKNLLNHQEYERILVEAVNKHFDLKPLARPADKVRQKKYFV